MTPKILGDVDKWKQLPARSPLVGVNPAWLTPTGHLVKHVRFDGSDGHYSKAESLHSHIFKRLGLPAHIVHHFSSPRGDNHYIYAPLEHGWKPIDHITGEAAKHLDPHMAAKVLTAEHMLGIMDRHAGNYVVKPGEKFVTPIDMGSTSSMQETSGVGNSALFHAMHWVHDGFRDTPLDTKLLDHLHNLMHDKEFLALGTDHRLHDAFEHLPATPRIGHLV